MSLLDLRRRIKSIKNTQKITRAMQLVAASKMKKAQDAALRGRPYAEELTTLIENIVHATGGRVEHPFFLRRVHPKKIAFIVFTADRGLCGAFNTNIIRYVVRREMAAGQTKQLICAGRKGMQSLKHAANATIVAEFDGLTDKPSFTDITGIARVAIDGFMAGDFDEVRVVYNRFVNTMTQEVTEKKLLPLSSIDIDGDGIADAKQRAFTTEYLFEPSPTRVLDRMLPRYIETIIWQALLESNASEQSARMVAMKSATDNAKELTSALTLEMNKARQAAITTEIAEIVGGAEALAA